MKQCPNCKHPDVKFIGRANVNMAKTKEERQYWQKHGKKTFKCSKCDYEYQYGR